MHNWKRRITIEKAESFKILSMFVTQVEAGIKKNTVACGNKRNTDPWASTKHHNYGMHAFSYAMFRSSVANIKRNLSMTVLFQRNWHIIKITEPSLKVVGPICSLKMWDWIKKIMVCRSKGHVGTLLKN